jgi:hypothetical protein
VVLRGLDDRCHAGDLDGQVIQVGVVVQEHRCNGLCLGLAGLDVGCENLIADLELADRYRGPEARSTLVPALKLIPPNDASAPSAPASSAVDAPSSAAKLDCSISARRPSWGEDALRLGHGSPSALDQK